VKIKEFDILTKGKKGSWWETPTGNYQILGKETNHFSSIGGVWMPYSMQFYGNYFIHGWPYHEDGSPVAKNYSGGCIRLATEDARAVFDFAKKGTPVLVLEDEENINFGSLRPKTGNVVLPAITARAFLIADIASGETILEKQAGQALPVASLTKLMTGLVAHEMVYLGRTIKVDSQMLANALQSFNIVIGKTYSGFDLLYPLLMQSSNDAAKTLAAFLGEQDFVQNMNSKAASLKMKDTRFADASGISAQNVSTADDLLKLLQYIYYKRRFILDITKGKVFENVGTVNIGDTVGIGYLKNFNEFAADPDLIGMKNGETSAAKQTIATLWNIHTPSGDVPVAIIVLGSESRVQDTEKLLGWLKDNFEIIK
jgi:D-alanyl-D-alanine carboxypeptidase